MVPQCSRVPLAAPSEVAHWNLTWRTDDGSGQVVNYLAAGRCGVQAVPFRPAGLPGSGPAPCLGAGPNVCRAFIHPPSTPEAGPSSHAGCLTRCPKARLSASLPARPPEKPETAPRAQRSPDRGPCTNGMANAARRKVHPMTRVSTSGRRAGRNLRRGRSSRSGPPRSRRRTTFPAWSTNFKPRRRVRASTPSLSTKSSSPGRSPERVGGRSYPRGLVKNPGSRASWPFGCSHANGPWGH